ncbi:MAG: oligosaccharide flippase family protein [Microgenomates group bacterium]|nr:oligosaccharide flippase family protein [Candidatus Woesebacteria bacterium]MBP6883282.1 oligosaccharide flippase family protein [Candidatus Woesebacteria bacterium]QQR64164.1 MAG: oligosaccharide flippase family protein [Candidatus Roizmanbacteria bacterium]
MLKKFTIFLKHPTSIHIYINTLGNYLNTAFTAIFALVLVRAMTPAEYGVLGVLLGVSYVLANIFDFGTTATIYSYLPAMLEKRTGNLYNFVKTLFIYQTIFATASVVILLFTFSWLDKYFFKTGADQLTIYLVFLGVIFFIWQNFISNVLLAGKHFFRVNLYVNISNVIKLALLGVLVYTNQITPASVILVFSVLGSIAFFIPLLFEKRSAIRSVVGSRFDRTELKFGYTLTYFASTQLYNLALRMDLFMLSFFGLRNDVGFYALAQKIILSIITSIISVTQVLSPLFSKASTKRDVQKLLKPGLLYLSVPAILFVILFFIPDSLFRLLFTEKFVTASQIAKSLSFPFIIFTYSNFLLIFMLYTIKKPAYVLLSNAIFFIGMTVGCLIFIPKLGVFAPAWVIAASISASSIILGITSFHEYKKLEN